MKKSYTQFFLILLLPSLHAMEDETPEEMNKNINHDANINKILKINDPVKFNLLIQQFVIKNHPQRESQKMGKEEELKSLQDSMSKIIGLNTGLLEELDELSDQSVQQCNEARQLGGFYAFAWLLSTGILLGLEGYLLFQEFSTEAKVMSGAILFPAAYTTTTKFFNDANKIINNTHINEQIEKQIRKIKVLSKIKNNIAKDIKYLTKEINSQYKNESLSDKYADSSASRE